MILPTSMYFGADPEGFLRKNGKVVGSERLIPPNGLRLSSSKVVRDGVQFEFNPKPGSTPALLGRNIVHCIFALNTSIQRATDNGDPGYSYSFDGVVDVDPTELATLSPESRALGCQASFNVYGEKPILVSGDTYTKRSGGGHLHLGLPPNLRLAYNRIVPLLDIMLGNTCVLLDRDPNAAERRKNYGRAGEYRTPEYGVEYRTLSNFWLRSPILLNFVAGMANMGVSILRATFNGQNLEQELSDQLSIGPFIQAIDNNDFALALENFNSLKPFLRKHLPTEGFPLNNANLDKFGDFAENIERRGLGAYFPEERTIIDWTSQRFIAFSEYFANVV